MTSTDHSHGFSEHPIYHLGDEVAKICAPLFKTFPINYFAYGHIYNTNEKENKRKITLLASDTKWALFYLKNNNKILIVRNPILKFIAFRGELIFCCLPYTYILPQLILSTPNNERANSVRPDPRRPAIPNISPLRRLILIFFNSFSGSDSAKK